VVHSENGAELDGEEFPSFAQVEAALTEYNPERSLMHLKKLLETELKEHWTAVRTAEATEEEFGEYAADVTRGLSLMAVRSRD
jgi:hypothetical protein